MAYRRDPLAASLGVPMARVPAALPDQGHQCSGRLGGCRQDEGVVSSASRCLWCYVPSPAPVLALLWVLCGSMCHVVCATFVWKYVPRLCVQLRVGVPSPAPCWHCCGFCVEVCAAFVWKYVPRFCVQLRVGVWRRCFLFATSNRSVPTGLKVSVMRCGRTVWAHISTTLMLICPTGRFAPSQPCVADDVLFGVGGTLLEVQVLSIA
jgi:hypothetical protein